MTIAADLGRWLTAAGRAVLRVIEFPLEALLRPFEAQRRERDAVSRRVREMIAEFEGRGVRASAPPPASSARESPPTPIESRRGPALPTANRFAASLEGLAVESRRIVDEARTRAYRQAGGHLNPQLDHRQMIDDLGVDRAAEVSRVYDALSGARPWTYVARRPDARAHAALMAQMSARRWLRRPSSADLRSRFAHYGQPRS